MSVLCAGCRASEPGAAVYYRTGALAEAQLDALEEAIATAPFAVQSVASRHVPNEPARGIVRLRRGRDDVAELDRLTAWLQQQPAVAAAGRDSAIVFH